MENRVINENKGLVERINALQAMLDRHQKMLELCMELVDNFGHFLPHVIKEFKTEMKKYLSFLGPYLRPVKKRLVSSPYIFKGYAMTLSSELDKRIAKKESDEARNKKKDTTPPDNYGDRYVTGLEKMRTQGKGTRIRDIGGWDSDEVTDRLRKIYGEKKAK